MDLMGGNDSMKTFRGRNHTQTPSSAASERESGENEREKGEKEREKDEEK